MKPMSIRAVDPECPHCHGNQGWIIEGKGWVRCACAKRISTHSSWEEWVPDASRENLDVDEHNHYVIEKLDTVSYDPFAPARGALIKGGPGRGKSWIAAATLRRLGSQEPFPSSQYIFWDEFLNEAHDIKMSEHPSLQRLFEEYIRKPLLLLLDDVGADLTFAETRSTDFTRKLLLRVLEERLKIRGSITFLTTNFRDNQDWKTYALPSAISRLAGLCQTIGVFELGGGDRRFQL